MEPGSQEAMAAASQERPDSGGHSVERRKSQRRTPPPEIGDTGNFRVDDRRLCRGRRWDDWKRT
jgi:hypothetical protein